jgi:hypothetical protein
MKQLSFEQIAKSAIAGSPILSDEMVAQYSLNDDTKPLYAYLYRIAAYAIDEIRKGEEFKRDEEDYVDALQECAYLFPQVLAATRAHKLSTYAQLTFRRHAARYLNLQDKGGMAGESGRWAGNCPHILSLEQLNPDDDGLSPADEDRGRSVAVEETWDDVTMYASAPMGYRNPLDELLADESIVIIEKTLANTRINVATSARLREEVGSFKK